MSLKISYKSICAFICALAGILSMNPYFVWPTFQNGNFTILVYIMYALSIMIMFKKISKIKISSILISFLFLIIYIITYLHVYGGESKITQKIGGLLLFFYLIMFCNLDKEKQANIFKIFVKIFVITLIPGLIYYIFELMGISLSIGIIQSENQLAYAQSAEGLNNTGIGYYKLYIGAVMRVSSNTRFSGIYDEAGLVGTIAALCLIANKLNIKSNWMKILLFVEIISFSLAGYILLIGYFLLNSIKNQKWKLVFGSIVILIVGYILLTIDTDNQLIKTLQERIILEDGIITIVNNRLSSKFDIGYSQFENSDFLTKLIGFGRGAATANEYINGSSSYKCSIYNYGYFGFGIMVFTIIVTYRKYLNKIFMEHWDEFCLLVIFILSIYQRPAIYYPYYFIILYGGAAFISSKSIDLNQERKEIRKCK